MAHIVFKWAAICSECGEKIGLKPGQKLPKECPHCHDDFDVEIKRVIAHDENDTTLLHE